MQKVTIHTHAPKPIVETPRRELVEIELTVDELIDDLAHVATVTIKREDENGKYARFFLRVGIDENGKPIAEIISLRTMTNPSRALLGGWVNLDKKY